jgi:Amt family ammonium transporter
VNGLWGVISVGIFADGTANYGGWQVSGLLAGNPSQLGAQIVGAVACFVWAFGASYVFFRVLDRVMGLRVSPEVELAGLDLPEMGIAGYIPDDLPSPHHDPVGHGVGLLPEPA